MTPDQINYAPLEKMSHIWLHELRYGMKGWAAPLLVLTSVGWILISLLSTAAGTAVFWLSVPAYFIVFLMEGIRYKYKIWTEFASANGWRMVPRDTAFSYVPTSLAFGRLPNPSPMIEAVIGNIPAYIFSYSTVTGSGRESHTWDFTVAVTSLPKAAPHMVLRAKGDTGDFLEELANKETIKLEGNFDDYFSLRVEKGQEVDALAIITPDVMQTLVSYNQHENLEFQGTNLYFIIRGQKLNPVVIKQLVTSVHQLSSQLYENVRLSGAPTP